MENSKKGNKRLIKLLIGIVCIVGVVITIILVFSNKEGEVTVNLKSTLDEIKEKSDLEAVTFTYNVIGKQCKDEEECDKTSNNIDDFKYVVSCKGTVTSGIKFDEIKLNLDESSKKLVIEMPEATITDTNISSTNFLNGDKIPASEIAHARKLCQQTLLEKVNADVELLDASKKQAEVVLTEYYKHIVKSFGNDYKVEVK